MKILGLIPARGGSKRVPNKNVRLLAGKPLIAYTIEPAQKAETVNRLVVSTDSDEIANIATEYGAEAPFRRPAAISKADSKEIEFFRHALSWLEEHESYEPDLIVLLFPTSPFRKAESIDKAVDLMLHYLEADSLRSVTLCSEHPYKMWIIENGYLKPFVETQDPNVHTLAYGSLPTVYIQNASIYITKPSTIREKGSYIGDTVLPFVMDATESIDINTPLDFQFAEMVMKGLK